ncbi:MAG: hypothetical protein ABW000_12765 [Actinoplanes sp.]
MSQVSKPSHRPKHAASAGGGWLRRGRRPTLADEISTAARELFICVDELHYSYDWPYEPAEQRAFDAVQQARRLISRDEHPSEASLLEALVPVTHEWWPELSPMMVGAREAVERIRRAAIVARYPQTALSEREVA